MANYSEDYLLDKKIKIFQPLDGYRASTDAVLLSAALIKVQKGDTILDAGSGTGAISLCLASRFQASGISITGYEIQPFLADMANQSADANGFADFTKFTNADIFKQPPQFCSFSHVISNPPYSDHDLPSPNLSKATAHNFQENDLSGWISLMIKLIKPRGRFYMINRAEALEEILAVIHGKLGAIEIIPLYSKSGQNAKRVIIRAQKDSKAPLILHPGIIIHDDNGDYTTEAQQILRCGGVLG